MSWNVLVRRHLNWNILMWRHLYWNILVCRHQKAKNYLQRTSTFLQFLSKYKSTHPNHLNYNFHHNKPSIPSNSFNKLESFPPPILIVALLFHSIFMSILLFVILVIFVVVDIFCCCEWFWQIKYKNLLSARLTEKNISSRRNEGKKRNKNMKNSHNIVSNICSYS